MAKETAAESHNSAESRYLTASPATGKFQAEFAMSSKTQTPQEVES